MGPTGSDVGDKVIERVRRKDVLLEALCKIDRVTVADRKLVDYGTFSEHAWRGELLIRRHGEVREREEATTSDEGRRE